MERSTDANAYAAGGNGSVSSGSVSYGLAQTSNDAWNDRPTSVHAGSASEAGQYSSVIPASQRRQQSHTSDVQEYGFSTSLYLSVLYNIQNFLPIL